MELEATYSNGSKVIYRAENNLLNTMIVILRKNILHMECLRDPYSDPFYLYYTSMIFLKRLPYGFQTYLQMTQVCSLKELHITIL